MLCHSNSSFLQANTQSRDIILLFIHILLIPQKVTELPVAMTLPVMLGMLNEKERFNPHILLVLNMQVRVFIVFLCFKTKNGFSDEKLDNKLLNNNFPDPTINKSK